MAKVDENEKKVYVALYDDQGTFIQSEPEGFLTLLRNDPTFTRRVCSRIRRINGYDLKFFADSLINCAENNIAEVNAVLTTINAQLKVVCPELDLRLDRYRKYTGRVFSFKDQRGRGSESMTIHTICV